MGQVDVSRPSRATRRRSIARGATSQLRTRSVIDRVGAHARVPAGTSVADRARTQRTIRK
jgi:hypothetical protein